MHAPFSDTTYQALVDELELKLDQDERLVKEVHARFREESSEKQACEVDSTSMKKAIQERAALQHEMLQTRYKQHDTLQRSNATNTERLSQVRPLASWGVVLVGLTRRVLIVVAHLVSRGAKAT